MSGVVTAWLRTPPGKVALAGSAIVLVVLLGFSLAGSDLAAGLLLALAGTAAGPAMAYLVSLPIRRRGFGRGYAREIFAVWVAYVAAVAFVVGGALSLPVDRPFGSPGSAAAGLVQGFGTTFWPLLVYRLRGASDAGAARRLVLTALGLHTSAMTAGVLVGLVAGVYVVWPLTR